MKRLVLIDSHAIIHRAYHALPPLSTPTGEAAGAVYGFTSILLRTIRELKPDYIAAAFDLPGPTFRHIAYERYKAQRPETPSDLSSQFGKVKEILEAFAIPVFEDPGFEADDIIGTIAKKLEKNKNVEVIIVTGDMDALQLVRPRLTVYSMRKGITDTVIYDEKMVFERYGLKPRALIDFKGLKGDPSDNISGVKGIGEKTATELLQTFGSIEGVYKALRKPSSAKASEGKAKKISESVALKLREGEKDAMLSKELATINQKVPISFSLEGTRWHDGMDTASVRAVLQKFGFASILKRLTEAEQGNAPQGTQPTLMQPAPSGAGLSITTLAAREDFEMFRSLVGKKKLGLFAEPKGFFLIPEGVKKVFFLETTCIRDPLVSKFFHDPPPLFVFDGKRCIRNFRAAGVELGPIQFDMALAAFLTGSAARDFSYLGVVSRELGRLTSQKPEEEYSHFFEIVKTLEEKIQEQKLERVLYEIELPISRILVDLEERGILIDRAYIKELAGEIDLAIARETKKVYGLAGAEFNINSSQQLSRILFETLGLRTAGLRKTEKGGVVSTRESELEKLQALHPIIQKILDYRELAKLKSTYVDVLPTLAGADNKIHTTFNQTGTATGRLSSSSPNMQNIPVMTEFGRKVRMAFIASKGFELVSFDYSQIELRVAAHLANDKKMIDAFKKGLDIHKMTAAEIYNLPLDKVTPDLRRAAKTLNFGVLYGMGAQAFSESTGFSREDAKKFIDEYFKNFSGVRRYIEATKAFAEEHGYVQTLFGRRRHIPEIHSQNWQIRREAERMAINMPIQGTATGDIIKIAMIHVDRWIKKEKLEGEIRMLLQVHDELLFEIKTSEIKKAAPKIQSIMEHAADLKAPLAVDIKYGVNWGEQRMLT